MNTPPDQPPRFVSCRCQHCDAHIEFDANGFQEGDTATVKCPDCLAETAIIVPPISPAEQSLLGVATPPPSGIELFYYKIGDLEKGPYTFEQLRSLWNSGQITGDAIYRGEQSSEWALLSVRIGKQAQNSFLQLNKLTNLLLKCICVISLIAFFLPNATVSLPIFGKIEVSMFDFLTPKPDNAAVAGEKTEKPNIKNVIDSGDLQIKKASVGAIICALSVVGIMLHYLLTLIWGVFAFAFKRTFSFLNIAWLSLALQFPIVFSIGAHIVISAMKVEAMSDTRNNAGDDSGGAAIGTALGAAFVNNISIQPGAVMWVLMALALFVMSLPRLARQFKPAA
jgi:hypothetical protein